jgi:hypothetical protein
MKIIDLRSDTVTKPTCEMRDIMKFAIVGDDVYQEDPTINCLEQQIANMFNKEALEEIVRVHPGSFPAKKLLENFHLFEQIFHVLNGKWIYGCGSYLINGMEYKYCPTMLKKQEELYKTKIIFSYNKSILIVCVFYSSK